MDSKKEKLVCSKITDEKINESVKNFYEKVANNDETVKVDAYDLSRSIGYSKEELDAVPEEANLGLGCGNPLEKGGAKEGEIIVDLGCGKGMDCFIAAKKVKESGLVIGVDMTASMLSTARKIAKKRKIENVDFRLGEIENLPIANEFCDLVISNCVINLSTRKQRVYDEAFRILKKGGRLSISDTIIVKPLTTEMKEDPKMYGTCIAGASTEEEIRKILEKAGFTDIELEINEVSKEYAKKWGFDFDITPYIRKTITTAIKK